MRLLSSAKLNLTLEITGKHANGYHELNSLFSFLDLADVVEIRPSSTPQINFNGPFASLVDPQENTLTQALYYFEKETGSCPCLTITVTKNIPTGAGLAGGSGNAAAVLSYLQDACTIPEKSIIKIAEKVGSDTPACLDSRPKQVTGTGGIIRPLPALPPFYCVLVKPQASLGAGEVYQHHNYSGPKTISNIPDFSDLAGLIDYLNAHPNDLTASATSLCPEIEEIIKKIAVLPGCLLARMTGSGSTCFGIFATKPEADQAIEMLKGSEYWLATAQPLS